MADSVIKIKIVKNKNKYKSMTFSGHASHDFGKPGYNILCAAISVLSQALFSYLFDRQYLSDLRIGDGFLFVEVSKIHVDRVFNNIEMIYEAILNLEKQYPEYLKVEEVVQ